MIIREAKGRDTQAVILFYDAMCRELDGKGFLPNGDKGGFPPTSMIESAIKAKGLYIGEEDGGIMAAYILNHSADSAYDGIKWQVEAEKDKISILHALRVAADYSGRGYATRLLEHSLETAKKKGQAAIRLDCLVENTVPARMYETHGFQYIDTVSIFYEDIGETRDFKLYEFVIC